MQDIQCETFFDENSETYGCLEPREIDYYFMTFIKIKKDYNKATLLDIGGGAGRFAKLCCDNLSNIDICIIDPSPKLLSLQKIPEVQVIQGLLPNKLNIRQKFDFIHLQNVLHHVTGKSIKESKILFKESLMNIKDLLEEGGYILIGDLVFESYFIKSFTRTIIFYILKIQNSLKFPLPFKDFKLGLEVCFYTTDEFKQIFDQCGLKVIEYFESEQKVPRLSLGLCKKYAQNRIILTKM